VSPSSGELFYLRMMLVSKRACSYDDIRTIGNVVYLSFRDACFAMGFLEDDKEFVVAIKEVSHWAT
jgi:hypothetical protein